MRHLNHWPIWRDANLLMLEIERAVRGFARYHKYTIGSELRATALRLCQTLHALIRANPVGTGSGALTECLLPHHGEDQ